ncbi:MAG TPA: DUF3597 domain-containing protein [Casimicrobiaceae bacterium]|jgi:hypothetical protein|nr:DUF3597 domain-containing protein [Casimicrobiaceae bacterium]
MSIFGSILDKILHHASPGSAQAASPGATAQPGQQGGGAATQQAQSAGATAAAPTQQAGMAAGGAQQRLQSVDVDQVLSRLASQKGGGGNWRTSIVDLLKLLDLDSSLNARKGLANELNVHAGADGSAEENIALHKAVMQKIAENGGKVPDSLRH